MKRLHTERITDHATGHTALAAAVLHAATVDAANGDDDARDWLSTVGVVWVDDLAPMNADTDAVMRQLWRAAELPQAA